MINREEAASFAVEQGIEVEGQKEAISIMAEWLISKRKIIKQGIIWPSWKSYGRSYYDSNSTSFSNN